MTRKDAYNIFQSSNTAFISKVKTSMRKEEVKEREGDVEGERIPLPDSLDLGVGAGSIPDFLDDI